MKKTSTGLLTIDAVYILTFVVSSEKKEVVWKLELVAEQKQYRLDVLSSAIDII